jgi:uncharacterized membrane protein YjjP (DUF1212 family)
MIYKIFTGAVTGTFVGIFVTAIIQMNTHNLLELFLTKITATAIITGVLCGIYAHLSNSKLQVFFISICIGIIVFYLKYLLTGQDLDALTMGTFVGAMLGGFFAVIMKITDSYKIFKRLRRRRSKGFGNYN